MMPRSALWLLKRLPWEVYAAGACVAALVTLWAGIASYGDSRYQAGRRSVTQSAHFDLATRTLARRADSIATAHTDTVMQRLVVTRWKVDTLLRQLPETLQVVPEVRALVANVYTLTAQVDTLARTLDVERAISRLRASVDSAALASAALTIASKEDQIVSLKKRPQWRTVGAVGVLAFVAGLLR
jgi:hypothetical protein